MVSAVVRADAIVVLGCRVLAGGGPSPTAKRRIVAAARAYRDGVATRVVASGGRRWGAHPEATVFQRELVREGVPEHAISLELCSLTTYENAIYTAAILKNLGAPRAAVVSCAWHLDRAVWDFRAAGVDAFGLPAHGPEVGGWVRARRRFLELCSHGFDVLAMRRAACLHESARDYQAPRVAATASSANTSPENTKVA